MGCVTDLHVGPCLRFMHRIGSELLGELVRFRLKLDDAAAGVFYQKSSSVGRIVALRTGDDEAAGNCESAEAAVRLRTETIG